MASDCGDYDENSLAKIFQDRHSGASIILFLVYVSLFDNFISILQDLTQQDTKKCLAKHG